MNATDWWIRGVDDTTKRQVKAYAAAHGLTIAQALAALVAQALAQA